MHPSLPHRQGAEFNAEPSVTVHGGPAQKLLEDVQKYPEAEVQLVVPHAQSMELAVDPSTFEQTATLAHTLMAAVQKNPEVEVQPVVPQRHVTPLVFEPSTCVQTGAEKQRHLELVEQELVEEDSVLKERLNWLLVKHPGG